MTDLQHVGILGMKWGRRTASSSGRSRFARSLKQKYSVTTSQAMTKFKRTPVVKSMDKTKRFLEKKFNRTTFADAILGTGKNAMLMAGAFTAVYGTMVLSEIAVNSIPKIAWATGTIISNSPLR